MFRIPYELGEAVFGHWLAENFNIILSSIAFIGIFVYVIRSKISASKKQKQRKRKKWKNPKWTPSGWVYNEKTQKWEGPDYPHKNGRRVSPTGWTFNEETQLWEPPNDLEKK